MKQLLTLLTAGTLMLGACQSPDADKAQTGEEQAAAEGAGNAFTIDSTTSKVAWIGTKVGGQHNGTISIKEGTFTVDAGNLTGGNFVIDMTSVTVVDLEGEDKASLEGHLKSGDFFQADSFPTATFVVTNVAPFDSTAATSKLQGATHNISGNLTLRGVTKNVTFPAIVSIEGNSVNAQADFNIDRSLWNVNFKGPNNPADWVIAKEVNLKLDVKGNNTL